MQGYACSQCDEWYDAMKNTMGPRPSGELCSHSSRHRYRNAPPQTPPGYWEVCSPAMPATPAKPLVERPHRIDFSVVDEADELGFDSQPIEAAPLPRAPPARPAERPVERPVERPAVAAERPVAQAPAARGRKASPSLPSEADSIPCNAPPEEEDLYDGVCAEVAASLHCDNNPIIHSSFELIE